MEGSFEILSNKSTKQEKKKQSGFREGRTCTDNVFALKQIIEKRLNTNQEIHLMCIDLHKAYDTVPIKNV